MRLCCKFEFANTFGKLCETIALQLSKKRTFKGSTFVNEQMRMSEVWGSDARKPYCNKKRQRSYPCGSASAGELSIGSVAQRCTVRDGWSKEASLFPLASKIMKGFGNYEPIIYQASELWPERIVGILWYKWMGTTFDLLYGKGRTQATISERSRLETRNFLSPLKFSQKEERHTASYKVVTRTFFFRGFYFGLGCTGHRNQKRRKISSTGAVT